MCRCRKQIKLLSVGISGIVKGFSILNLLSQKEVNSVDLLPKAKQIDWKKIPADLVDIIFILKVEHKR